MRSEHVGACESVCGCWRLRRGWVGRCPVPELEAPDSEMPQGDRDATVAMPGPRATLGRGGHAL